MNRVFLEVSQQDLIAAQQGQALELKPELSHHLTRVLRLVEGSQLEVFIKIKDDLTSHGQALGFLALIAENKDKHSVKVKLIRSLEPTVEDLRHKLSSVICALPKGPHADQICEQASQFGIDRIIFFQAERCVMNLGSVEKRLVRWQKITESSARQSAAREIPKVYYSDSLESLMTLLANLNLLDLQENNFWLCSLSNKAMTLGSDLLKAMRRNSHIIVGPEGDFTLAEEERFLGLGAIPITLGKQIYRVETAVVVALASINTLIFGTEEKSLTEKFLTEPEL